MGESTTVLFHSYSFAAPLSRNDSHEDNRIHALSQSVSFGRFMTENLEWEKWSSFSHKKYVDEAEKYSQPGSVAQKKAFFEAHYKRIAEAKKAKALLESSDLTQQQQQQQQEPESVTGLLNTLETLTNDEVKKEESDETKLVVSNIEKDKEHESKSVEILEKEEAKVDKLVVKSVVADDLQAAHETEPKENYSENEELLKKSSSVREKEEERRSVSKNTSVFRSSMETSATSETPEKAMEPIFSQKISEKPETHSLTLKNEKPVSARFGFLSSLLGSTKTEDQNPTRKKRKTGKKPNNSFLCLCFKPEMVGETEAARR